MHAELELHKAKSDSLDDALKLSREAIAATEGVVREQNGRLDAAGAGMA